MSAGYEHDWEDPRLAVEGFVTDYIVWRLAKEGLEWHEAPDVPEGSETEHEAMRSMCEIFEERNGKDLLLLTQDLFQKQGLNFAEYCEAVAEFVRNEADIPDEMTYGRMVGLIAFAGVICAQKAREGNRTDLGRIALYTCKYIDGKIRLTWIESMRSWDRFMDMARNVVVRRSRPNSTLPPPPVPLPPQQQPAAYRRRSSLLYVATGVSIVGLGAFITHRVLMRSH